MQRVTIEALPYQELIQRYDARSTLFYLDPPYWGSEDIYGLGEFQRSDFEDLADILAQIKGQFILSLNDAPGVRDVFSAFKQVAVSTSYTVAQASGKRVGELIISST